MTDDLPENVAPHPLDRPLADVAGAIIDDCERHYHRVPPEAEPYLRTLLGVATTDLRAHHGDERVADIVRGALDNLHDWRTDTAWRIKHQLRAALAAADEPPGRPRVE